MDKRTFLLTSAWASFSGFTLSSCGGGDQYYVARDRLLKTAQRYPEISSAIAALRFASENNDLIDLLESESALFFVAPTNSAFDELARDTLNNPNAKGTDLFTVDNKAFLRSVMLYHLVRGEFLPVPSDSGAVRVYTKGITGIAFSLLPNNFFSVGAISVNSTGYTDGRNRNCETEYPGPIAAFNGEITKLNRVMLPANKTAGEYFDAKTSEFSTLLAAIDFAGESGDLFKLLNGTEPITILAPNNKAFDDLAVDLSGNINAKGVDLLVAANKALIRAALKSHIILGLHFINEFTVYLPNTAGVPTLPAPLLTIQGSKLTFSDDYKITAGRKRAGQLRGSQAFSTNGVIVFFDTLLLPDVF